ncbi:glycerophosphodiester phosphodiesterase family protein [Eisenibacter elegans]|jgi:glycerophosphoryl diester phosphodiesterase|uniref:glycerophosphodiester phosphodiesterase family protein n=1 Tax=Eisenibacter elegans TaxID=997 RepID=UPI0003F83239|nr:glycerophosphodiester phosphodiesterase family protein [Eisenibacter elegans]
MRFLSRVVIGIIAVLLLGTFPLQAQRYRLAPKTQAALYQIFAYSPERVPIVSAHRGGPAAGYPENCPQTFAHTLDHVPAIIECDISLSQDSVLFMLHDNKLDRTTTGSGPVNQTPWKQIRKLHLKDNSGQETKFKVPTLAQCLRWGKGKTVLQLDIKRGIRPEQIVAAIRKAKAAHRVMVICYTLEQAQAYHTLAPDLLLSVSANNIEEWEAHKAAGIPPQQMVVFTGVDTLKPELYAAVHADGAMCIIGAMRAIDKAATQDGLTVYQDIAQQGVDVFATDRPMAFAEWIIPLLQQNNTQGWLFK